MALGRLLVELPSLLVRFKRFDHATSFSWVRKQAGNGILRKAAFFDLCGTGHLSVEDNLRSRPEAEELVEPVVYVLAKPEEAPHWFEANRVSCAR